MSTAVAGVPPACGGFGGSGKKGGEPEDVGKRRRDGFFIEEEEEEAGALTESSSIGSPSPASSSIGENSSSEAVGKVEGEQEEVESKLREEEKEEEGLGSLDSLEDSLPIKRGLSNFYAGKSKSFTSLAESAATAAVKELAKPENPLNKRRRILTAWSRRASCSSLVTTYLPPLLAPDHAVAEEDEEEEDSDNEEDLQQHKYKYNKNHKHQNNKNNKEKDVPTFPPPMLNAHTQMGMMVRNGTFRSPRSFSLSDLQNTSYN